MRPAKSVNQMSKNLTKAEISAREEAEEQVVTNQTKPKPNKELSKVERKVFHKLKKYNDQFTEADSISLNMLSSYMIMWQELKDARDQLDILDERMPVVERRLLALDKVIKEHMTALCIPLNSRLKLANDMAKVMIEERKLEQMENENKPEQNPLMAVLEATKHVK